ncbi:MAG: response regulator [Anaerolineales bacterium]|nr:response regulator [Chloroflexota bacterium]MBL6980450.1 response regulator [Anaerolineales bacterium]
MPRVMLIDDDFIVLDLLKTLLEMEGHEIFTFSWDEDIVESVQKNQPDVVLMDIYLRTSPGGDKEGLKFLAQIRDIPDLAETKVIMTSGIDLHVESKQAGADGFLHKPYMPEELINLLKQILSS